MEDTNQQPLATAPAQNKVIDQVTPVSNAQLIADEPTEQHQDTKNEQPPKVIAKSNSATIAITLGITAIIILIAIALLAYKKTG
jgi:hypothetical protein